MEIIKPIKIVGITASKVKTSLKAIGIGTLAVTATLLFSPEKDLSMDLRGQAFSPEEYGQIKGQLIEKFKDRNDYKDSKSSSEIMSFPELQAWGAVANADMGECGILKTKFTSVEDLLNQINTISEKGCLTN